MVMNELLVITGVTVCQIVILAGVMTIRSERRKSPFRNDSVRRHVYVSKGVETAGLTYGRGKGDAFFGELQRGTVLESGKVQPCVSIRILNQGLGKETQMYFHHTLIFGRPAGGMVETGKYCVYSDPCVSRNHCELFLQNGTLYLRDLKAHNNTYLNDRKVTGFVQVRQGDVISIGYTKLRINYSIL